MAGITAVLVTKVTRIEIHTRRWAASFSLPSHRQWANENQRSADNRATIVNDQPNVARASLTIARLARSLAFRSASRDVKNHSGSWFHKAPRVIKNNPTPTMTATTATNR